VAPPSVEEFNSFAAVSRQRVRQQSQQSAGRTMQSSLMEMAELMIHQRLQQMEEDRQHRLQRERDREEDRREEWRRREEEQRRRDDDQRRRDDEWRDLMAMFQVALSAYLHGTNLNGSNGSNNNN
jgi:hypothetical protein